MTLRGLLALLDLSTLPLSVRVSILSTATAAWVAVIVLVLIGAVHVPLH